MRSERDRVNSQVATQYAARSDPRGDNRWNLDMTFDGTIGGQDSRGAPKRQPKNRS